MLDRNSNYFSSPEGLRNIKSIQLQAQYGISLKVYETMLTEQDGGCAICGIKQEDGDRCLAVDHCHRTQKVRGLLCFNCNTGLGKLGDSVEGLTKALIYLQRAETGSDSIAEILATASKRKKRLQQKREKVKLAKQQKRSKQL